MLQVAGIRQVNDAPLDQEGLPNAFYQKYGFIPLPKIERRLFLPMGTVAELFNA